MGKEEPLLKLTEIDGELHAVVTLNDIQTFRVADIKELYMWGTPDGVVHCHAEIRAGPTKTS